MQTLEQFLTNKDQYHEQIAALFNNRVSAITPADLGNTLDLKFTGEDDFSKRFQAAAQQASISLNEDNDENYMVVGSTAILPLVGRMVPDAGWWGKYMGLASTNSFISDMNRLADDNSIKRIIVYADSPGGAVDRVDEAHKATKRAADLKTVDVFAQHMNSACYWALCPADSISLSPTGSAGSISGLMGPLVDRTAEFEQVGRKFHYIRGFESKALGLVGEAVDETVLASYQKDVDEVTAVFVDAVSSTRNGLTPRSIQGLDGESFIGRQALTNKLVDALASFDEMLASIQTERGVIIVSEDKKDQTKIEWAQVDADVLKAQNPGLYSSIVGIARTAGAESRDEEVAGLKAEINTLKAEKGELESSASAADRKAMVEKAVNAKGLPKAIFLGDKAAFTLAMIDLASKADSLEAATTAINNEISSRVTMYEEMSAESGIKPEANTELSDEDAPTADAMADAKTNASSDLAADEFDDSFENSPLFGL